MATQWANMTDDQIKAAIIDNLIPLHVAGRAETTIERGVIDAYRQYGPDALRLRVYDQGYNNGYVEVAGSAGVDGIAQGEVAFKYDFLRGTSYSAEGELIGYALQVSTDGSHETKIPLLPGLGGAQYVLDSNGLEGGTAKYDVSRRASVGAGFKLENGELTSVEGEVGGTIYGIFGAKIKLGYEYIDTPVIELNSDYYKPLHTSNVWLNPGEYPDSPPFEVRSIYGFLKRDYQGELNVSSLSEFNDNVKSHVQNFGIPLPEAVALEAQAQIGNIHGNPTITGMKYNDVKDYALGQYNGHDVNAIITDSTPPVFPPYGDQLLSINSDINSLFPQTSVFGNGLIQGIHLDMPEEATQSDIFMTTVQTRGELEAGGLFAPIMTVGQDPNATTVLGGYLGVEQDELGAPGRLTLYDYNLDGSASDSLMGLGQDALNAQQALDPLGLKGIKSRDVLAAKKIDSNGEVVEEARATLLTAEGDEEAPDANDVVAEGGFFVAEGGQQAVESADGQTQGVLVDHNTQVTSADGDVTTFGKVMDFFYSNDLKEASFAQNVLDFNNDEVLNGADYGALAVHILSRMNNGEDLDDIVVDIATNRISTEASEYLMDVLGIETGSVLDGVVWDDYAVDAIKLVAFEALLNGGENVEQVAISAGLNKATIYALRETSLQKVFTQPMIDHATGDQVVKNIGGENVPQTELNPNGAGTAQAVIAFASSILAGESVSAAAVQGALGYAQGYLATSITQTLAATYSWGAGSFALGAATAGVGLVVGMAIQMATAGIFRAKVHDYSTVSHVVIPKEDGTGVEIVALREAGALLNPGREGDNDYTGNNGADNLIGGTGQNNMIGNGGNDFIEGGDGDDFIIGDDAANLETGDDHIEAGDGHDYAEGGKGKDKIYGGAGDDSVLGGEDDDIVLGGDGDDRVEGNEGNDEVFGGDGDDVLSGGEGDDLLNGGEGDDALVGEDGHDILEGGIGNDHLFGDAGDDLLFGEEGHDELRGGDGDDILIGDDIGEGSGSGSDILYGNSGNDLLSGGAQADLLFGGTGNDVLVGGSGNDDVYGGFGQDVLFGDTGNDDLGGDAGNDLYIYGLGHGHDVIEDAEDTNLILMEAIVAAQLSISKDGDDLLIDISGNDSLRIKGHFLNEAAFGTLILEDSSIQLDMVSFDENGVGSFTPGIRDDALLAPYQSQIQDQKSLSYSGALTEIPSTWAEANFDLEIIGQIENYVYNDVEIRSFINSKWYGKKSITIYDHYETLLEGTSANDRIIGMFWGESIYGFDGDDQIYGNDGDDRIYGDSFNDNTEGYEDLIFGGDGIDKIAGQHGKDKIFGSNGDDVISGGRDNDTLYGEWGNDTVYGGLGDDFLSGGYDDDDLRGGDGSDLIFGDTGNDILKGGNGVDLLTGGAGNDELHGGNGNDIASFSGGRHNFEFEAENGILTVRDLRNNAFSEGTDTVSGVETLRFWDGEVSTDTLDLSFTAKIRPGSTLMQQIDLPEGATISNVVSTLPSNELSLSEDGLLTFTRGDAGSAEVSYDVILADGTIIPTTSALTAESVDLDQNYDGIYIESRDGDVPELDVGHNRIDSVRAFELGDDRYMVSWLNKDNGKYYQNIYDRFGNLENADTHPYAEYYVTGSGTSYDHETLGEQTHDREVTKDGGIASAKAKYMLEGIDAHVFDTDGFMEKIIRVDTTNKVYQIAISADPNSEKIALAWIEDVQNIGNIGGVGGHMARKAVIAEFGADGQEISGSRKTFNYSYHNTVQDSDYTHYLDAPTKIDVLYLENGSLAWNVLYEQRSYFNNATANPYRHTKLYVDGVLKDEGETNSVKLERLDDGGFIHSYNDKYNDQGEHIETTVLGGGDGFVQLDNGMSVAGRAFPIYQNSKAQFIVYNPDGSIELDDTFFSRTGSNGGLNDHYSGGLVELSSGEVRFFFEAFQGGDNISRIREGRIFVNSMAGTDGRDFLLGTDDIDDQISGYSGNDVIQGVGGNDNLLGGDGSDVLLGGSGNDTLKGGTGSDSLQGGSGINALYGEDGSDIFVIQKNSGGLDTIYDFDTSGLGEKIDLTAFDADFVNFIDLQSALFQNGADVEITLPDSQKVILKNVNLFDLKPMNFVGNAGFDHAPVAQDDSFATDEDTQLSGNVIGDMSVARYQPDVTELSNGDLIFSWTQIDAQGNSQIFQKRLEATASNYTPGQGELVSDIVRNPTLNWDFEYRYESSVTTLNGGNYVITWASTDSDGTSDNVYYQVFNASGEALDAAKRANTTEADIQFLPNVIPTVEGGFAISWWDAYHRNATYQKFDMNGIKVGSEVPVDMAMEHPGVHLVSLDDGGMIAVWNGRTQNTADLYEIYMNRYDADGNEQPRVLISDGHDHQRLAHPTLLDGGNIAIVWEDWIEHNGSERDILLKIVTPNGGVVLDQTVIGDHVNSSQFSPDITALTGGGFVVTWYDNNQDGFGNGVYAQIFNNNGIAAGQEMLVNTSTAGNQQHAEVTALSEGGFVVTWYAKGQHAESIPQIFVQRFDATGNKVFDEDLRIHDDTANDSDVETSSEALRVLAQTVISEQGAAIELQENGDFIYTPTSDFNGSDSFVYTLLDQYGQAAQGTVNITINPVNDAPVVAGDMVMVEEGTATIFDVRTNDNDVDLDELTVTSVSSGLVAINPDGTLTYTPDADFDAHDSFVYTLSDGQGGTDAGRVYLYTQAAGVVITGTSDDDHLNGTAEKDSLYGREGNDTLSGHGGDDALIGGGGTDTLDGGDGLDTALFLGNIADYSVTLNLDGSVTITDNTPDAFDGVQTLTNVERAKFADTTLDLDALFAMEATDLVILQNEAFEGQIPMLEGYTIALEAAPSEGAFVLHPDGRYNYTAPNDFSGSMSFQYRLTSADGVVNFLSEVEIKVAEVLEQDQQTSGPEELVSDIVLGTTGNWDLQYRYESNITTLNDGNYVITWASTDSDGTSDNVYYQVFNASGQALDDAQRANTTVTDIQFLPNVVSTVDGGFAISWWDAENVSAIYQKFDASGAKLGGEILIAPGMGNPGVSMVSLDDGGMIAVWNGRIAGTADLYEIYMNRYDSAGNEDPMVLISDGHDHQRLAHPVLLDDGNIAIVWEDWITHNGSERDILLKIVTPSGGTILNQTAVDDYVTSDQYSPSITALTGGGFVVSWSSNGQDGSSSGVYVKIFSNGGVPSGDEILVNSYTVGTQDQSEIKALSGGGFIVTWHSNGQDGSDRGVYAQRFDATGDKVGSEFQVHDNVSGKQYQPDVTELDNGDLIFTWTSWHSGSSQVIQKRFEASGQYVDLTGGEASETLVGGDTDDIIIGHGGDDVLIGRGGNDVLDGGDGSDIYIIGSKPGSTDTITNFEYEDLGEKIDLSAFDVDFTDFASFALNISQQGDDTSIDLGNGQTLILKNLESTDLSAQNFVGNASINNIPVAIDDAFSGDEDAPINGNVLADNGNGADSDPDGETLSVQPETITTAQGGMVELLTNGDFTYTPVSEFSGTDSFTYTVEDGQGGSSEGTVSLTVTGVDDAPVLTNMGSSVDEDGILTLTTTMLSLADADTAPSNRTFTLQNQPSNGTLYLNGVALMIAAVFTQQDIIDGLVTYEPAADFNGSDSFSVVGSDGTTDLPAATFNINVTSVNDAPIAAGDMISVDEDSQISFDPRTNDSDVDLDTLNIESVTQGANGTVTDNGDGTLTYTPNAEFSGTDSFTYIINDGNGETSEATVNVTVNAVNDAPVLAVNNGAVMDEDGTLTLTAAMLEASDIDTPANSLLFTLDSLPVNGDLKLSGTNLSVSQSFTMQDVLDGLVTFEPALNFNGSDGFDFTVSDGLLSLPQAAFSITVNPVNDNPEAQDDSFTGDQDANIVGNLLTNDSDLDGDTLNAVAGTYATTQGGSVTIATNGDFTYTPLVGFFGADGFEYTLEDGNGGSDIGQATINVESPYINFYDQLITGYGGTQNESDIHTIEDNGLTLHLSGNTWKKIDLPYTVTEQTVLVFDFKSDAIGDIHAIGLDTDDDINPASSFRVYGTQDWGVSDTDTYDGNEGQWVHYEINLGDYELGPKSYLFFTNDHDVATPDAESFFRNVRVYEDLSIIPNSDPDAIDDSVITDEGAAIIIDVLANDSDVDADALSVSAVGAASNGVVSINGDNTVTYTPNAGFSGTDSFTYTAADGNGGNSAATVHITVNAVVNIINGTEAEDTLQGTGGVDEIYGLGDRDVLYGYDGDDELYGGTDIDKLHGGQGNDLLDGGDGNDWAIYKDDIAAITADLSTGLATDGWGTQDTLVDIERIEGSSFDDFITGDGNKNVLKGLTGHDRILGGAGDDTIKGNGGHDVLLGEDGNDNINGGHGNDYIEGGAGSDDLYGSAGADVFVFNSFDGIDSLHDFSIADGDQLLFSEILLENFDSVQDAITDFIELTDDGTDTIVSFDFDGTENGTVFTQIVTLQGVTGLPDVATLKADGIILFEGDPGFPIPF